MVPGTAPEKDSRRCSRCVRWPDSPSTDLLALARLSPQKDRLGNRAFTCKCEVPELFAPPTLRHFEVSVSPVPELDEIVCGKGSILDPLGEMKADSLGKLRPINSGHGSVAVVHAKQLGLNVLPLSARLAGVGFILEVLNHPTKFLLTGFSH